MISFSPAAETLVSSAINDQSEDKSTFLFENSRWYSLYSIFGNGLSADNLIVERYILIVACDSIIFYIIVFIAMEEKAIENAKPINTGIPLHSEAIILTNSSCILCWRFCTSCRQSLQLFLHLSLFGFDALIHHKSEILVSQIQKVVIFDRSELNLGYYHLFFPFVEIYHQLRRKEHTCVKWMIVGVSLMHSCGNKSAPIFDENRAATLSLARVNRMQYPIIVAVGLALLSKKR
jgi:hypothetical protein